MLTSVQQVAVARTAAIEHTRRRLYEALNNEPVPPGLSADGLLRHLNERLNSTPLAVARASMHLALSELQNGMRSELVTWVVRAIEDFHDVPAVREALPEICDAVRVGVSIRCREENFSKVMESVLNHAKHGVKNVMLTDAGTARGGIATIAYSSILRTKGSEEVWRLAAQDISEILPSGTLDISDIEMRPVMALLRAVTRASTGREANFRLPDATVDLVMASCFRIYGYRNAPAELIVTAARAAEALFSLQTVGHEGLNNTLSALVGRIMPNIGFIECVATTELVTCVITTQPSITLASVQSVLGTMSGLLTYNIMVPSGPFFHADVLGAAIRATAGCLRGAPRRPFGLSAIVPNPLDFAKNVIGVLVALPLHYSALVGGTEAEVVITGAALYLLEVMADSFGAGVLEAVTAICPFFLTPQGDPLKARRLLGIITAVAHTRTGSSADAASGLGALLVETFVRRSDCPPPTVAAGITALVAVIQREDVAFAARLDLLANLNQCIESICTEPRPELYVVLMAAMRGAREVVGAHLFQQAAASPTQQGNPLFEQHVVQRGLAVLINAMSDLVERVHGVLALGDRRAAFSAIETALHIHNVMEDQRPANAVRAPYANKVFYCLDVFLASTHLANLQLAIDAGRDQRDIARAQRAAALPAAIPTNLEQAAQQVKEAREARMRQGHEPDEEITEGPDSQLDTEDELTWRVATTFHYLARSFREIGSLSPALTPRATTFMWTLLGLSSDDPQDTTALALREAGVTIGERQGCRLFTEVRTLELVAIFFQRPDVQETSTCAAAAALWFARAIGGLGEMCDLVNTDGRRVLSSPGVETDDGVSSTLHFASVLSTLSTLSHRTGKGKAGQLVYTHGTEVLLHALEHVVGSCDTPAIITWLHLVTWCLPPGLINVNTALNDTGLKEALTTPDFWVDAAEICETTEFAKSRILSLLQYEGTECDAAYMDTVTLAWEVSTQPPPNEQDEDEDEVGQQGQQTAGASMDQAAGHFDQAAAHGQDMTGDAGGMEI